MRSRATWTPSSSSSAPPSPTSSSLPSASKSRTHTHRRAEGRSRFCGPLIAGLGVTLVMLYMIFMISQVDPKPHLNNPQQQRSPPHNDQQHDQGETFQQQVHQVQQQLQMQQAQEQLAHGNECQYDGHCPLRSTCEATGTLATEKGVAKGICRPMESRGKAELLDDDPATTESCVKACRTELEMDEHFYQESWPVQEWYEPVPASTGRPRGCLHVYHRVPEGAHWTALQAQDDAAAPWKEVPPSVRNWSEHRFRHVIRVDPVNDQVNDDTWMAYCHNTCVVDADCATTSADAASADAASASASALPPFTCQLGACQRNEEYWNPTDKDDKDENGLVKNPEMVIVTGATLGYMKGLTNLCASLRYWAPHHKVVVYNLGGMMAEHIQEIEGWQNVVAVEWRDGVPPQYPPHVSKGKIYAWKPIIVNETLHKYKSIFWLDAGSTVAGPITPIENVIQRTGLMLVKGQDMDMKQKSFEATYEWFNTTKETFQAGPHYSGNTQAFMLPSRYVESVVLPNAACAMDPNCISPLGARLRNHRYDQTTISILAYHPKVRAPHYTEYLAAGKNQLNPDMRKPSFKMILTSRQSVKFYSVLERGLNASLEPEQTLAS